MPETARWSHIQKNARSENIGKIIDDAMEAIEAEPTNETPKGVLPKNYARPTLDKTMLGELVDLFSNIQMHDSTDRARDGSQEADEAARILVARHEAPHPMRHRPCPIVIWADWNDERIAVEISLFGLAMRYRDIIVEAILATMLTEAKGGQGGLARAPDRRDRVSWRPVDFYHRTQRGVRCPKAPKTFILRSVTPITLNGPNGLSGSFDSFADHLMRRNWGMARWHGLDLRDMNDATNRADLARILSIRMMRDPKPRSFTRRSRHFGAKPREELGFDLHMRIADYDERLWPLFVCNAYFNTGQSCGQGFGRYVIEDF